MKCKHCGRTKIEHREFVGGCFVCPDSHGGRPLTQFTPVDIYETPESLRGYETLVLATAIPIYVGLAERHPDAEGTSNHALAVREAKRLITQVVRDARRQDR